MQPANVRKMTDVIDKAGNALATLYGDETALQNLIGIFGK
jgi:hypothetical protein